MFYVPADIWIEVGIILVIVAVTGFISCSIGIKKDRDI